MITTLALFLLASAHPQDALTPTDVLEFGQFSVTGSFRMNAGSGTRTDLATDVDFDSKAYLFQLSAAVGIGMGFEVELSIPWQFLGTTEGDGTFLGADVTTEQAVNGFGDLTLAAIYRLLKEDTLTPQWIAGIIVQPPSGNDKRGDPEVILGGVLQQVEDEGSIGDGVWRYGFLTGVSKRLGIVEPYGLLSYVIGGTRTRNGIREDRADVLSLTGGVEWHVTPDATIDTRAYYQFVGRDITESSLAEEKAEPHGQFGAQALLYIRMGGGFTLVAGGGATLVQDHEIDATTGTQEEDVIFYQLVIGLHFLFGG